jgi:hypothetical protein
MKYIILILITVVLQNCSTKTYLEKDFYSGFTLKTERENFLNKTVNQTIKQSFSEPLNDSTESKYISAFWAMELIQYRDTLTDKAIRYCLSDFFNRSLRFQRALLEVIYAVYPNQFHQEVFELLPRLNNSKLFAMSVYYLRESLSVDSLIEITNQFEMKFMTAKEDPIIRMLKFDLQTNFRNNLNPPPLIDLLKHKIVDEKITIYSLQRLNRDYPGLLIIKKPDGKFLRDDSGEIFSVPQLARAISDLPGCITNGNTPEGIFSIQGTDVSKNVFIGPIPNLQLVLPFEVKPSIYFHNKRKESQWNIELYKELLPDSWKNYLPIFESYYAGEAGRNEIIAHGTTIDLSYYTDKSYYPFTPSQGCLTTKEIWSEETGRLIESDQLRFMNALKDLNIAEGFFIVVNIDDKQFPVTLAEVKKIIEEAER